ncbi:MAG: alkaline phosphatase D family protein, partial [Bacteroidota bacterium]
MRFLLLLLTYFISKTIFSQTPFPMLGHVGMRNAEILIHGVRQSDSLTIKLYNSEKILVQTKKAAVNHNLGHTCAIQFSQLTPNSNYLYQFNFHNFQSPLYSFKTQQLWQWRENPPPFTVAFGSCVYVNDSEFDRPGKPYGLSSTIFNSIMNEQPAAMIWGGDNVYFREGDWETATNMAERYVHTRSDSNIKNILMNVPNYAVWDDHDFGPNDSHGGFQFKNESQKVFRTMWPNQGYANFNGMNFGKIELNDIEIYFLDNRFNRTSPKLGKSAQMLGADQLEWLFNNLVTSKASFKLIVVGSQILNSEAVFETFANYSE